MTSDREKEILHSIDAIERDLRVLVSECYTREEVIYFVGKYFGIIREKLEQELMKEVDET